MSENSRPEKKSKKETKSLFPQFKGEISNAKEIYDQAVKQALKEQAEHPDASYSSQFDRSLIIAEELYRSDEKKAFNAFMQTHHVDEARSVSIWLGESFDMLGDTFKAMFNSRMSRAGKTLEYAFAAFLDKLGLLYKRQVPVKGRVDFVIYGSVNPDSQPTASRIVACKRTLRERWKQIIPEAGTQLRFWVVTIDKDVTQATLADMEQKGVCVVVPAQLKQSHYADRMNVLTLDDFIADLATIGIVPQQPPPSEVTEQDA